MKIETVLKHAWNLVNGKHAPESFTKALLEKQIEPGLIYFTEGGRSCACLYKEGTFSHLRIMNRPITEQELAQLRRSL